MRRRTKLQVDDILQWADAHRAAAGSWPTFQSGPVRGHPSEHWRAIDGALVDGSRGLLHGQSLARLLQKHRGRRNKQDLPRLTPEQVLAWADQHRRRTGDWPMKMSGPIVDAPGETWSGVDDALKRGGRGLPGGTSIAVLLAEARGRRHRRRQPPLTIRQILTWADAHHRRMGGWPQPTSGVVTDAPEESWGNLHAALVFGRRGLRKGSSLQHLLARHRGRPYQKKGPPLTVEQIVGWANEHFQRTGRWPTPDSGRVRGVKYETWSRIDNSLTEGLRGLQGEGGKTLRRLLHERCGATYERYTPDLSIEQILTWADLHHRRTGHWPASTSGDVTDAPDRNWWFIDSSLRYGRHGLPGGQGLAPLLAERRGHRHKHRQPHLDIQRILEWADAHHQRTGRWPNRKSGPIPEAPGENWQIIDVALNHGHRGLRGRDTLCKLLLDHRGVPYRRKGGPLSEAQIVQWARAYHDRTGRWPTERSGIVPEAPQEKWLTINSSLNAGNRGLQRGSSLLKLLVKRCGARDRFHPPRLTHQQILAWADAYYQRTGDWPMRNTGSIPESPGENWRGVHRALVEGRRGLRRGGSLVALFSTHRKLPYSRKGIPLTPAIILDWVREHHERTGAPPTAESGPVHGVRGETWAAIDASLRAGKRHMRGESSLAHFIAGHYQPRYAGAGRPLTEALILQWAEDFHQRVGYWPTVRSAFTDSLRQEKWSAIDAALREGHRGLPGGSSLAQLVREHRRQERTRRAAQPPHRAASRSIDRETDVRNAVRKLAAEFPHLDLPR